MEAVVALVGGTGIGDRLAVLPGRSIHCPTSRGLMRGRLVSIDGLPILTIQRHSIGHKTPPHRVPFEAIALGLSQMGIRWCLASAAIGSMNPGLPVGSFAACTDILDVSARRTTLFDRQVRHVDMGSVFPGSTALVESGGGRVAEKAVYVNVNGPRYESPAEIRMFQAMGGDVVGMTAGTEAIAMREAGVGYGCLAIVTNLAAGLSEGELAHGEVTDVMKTHGADALDIMVRAARILSSQ